MPAHTNNTQPTQNLEDPSMTYAFADNLCLQCDLHFDSLEGTVEICPSCHRIERAERMPRFHVVVSTIYSRRIKASLKSFTPDPLPLKDAIKLAREKMQDRVVSGVWLQVHDMEIPLIRADELLASITIPTVDAPLATPTVTSPVYPDPATWVACVRDALDMLDMTDALADDVNTAMAWIEEALEVRDEVEARADHVAAVLWNAGLEVDKQGETWEAWEDDTRITITDLHQDSLPDDTTKAFYCCTHEGGEVTSEVVIDNLFDVLVWFFAETGEARSVSEIHTLIETHKGN